jgi:predicted transglutaminase-like cysteine proteinase
MGEIFTGFAETPVTGLSTDCRAIPPAVRSICRTRDWIHRPVGWRVLLSALLLNVCACAPAIAGEFTMSRQAIMKIDEEHGEYARRRVIYWQQLIRSGSQHTDLEKLRLANDFFNELEFINDAEHWGKEDYWATPLQTLVTNGGDCEDFSIAKYFTLLEMGISPERMRLTYVKALRLNQAHMVLTYFPAPDAEPLVLDNLDTEIRPANKRTDLQPVYSFNVDGLWLAKSRAGESKHVGKSTRLSPWRDVIARINSEFTR